MDVYRIVKLISLIYGFMAFKFKSVFDVHTKQTFKQITNY